MLAILPEWRLLPTSADQHSYNPTWYIFYTSYKFNVKIRTFVIVWYFFLNSMWLHSGVARGAEGATASQYSWLAVAHIMSHMANISDRKKVFGFLSVHFNVIKLVGSTCCKLSAPIWKTNQRWYLPECEFVHDVDFIGDILQVLYLFPFSSLWFDSLQDYRYSNHGGTMKKKIFRNNRIKYCEASKLWLDGYKCCEGFSNSILRHESVQLAWTAY